MLLMTVSHLRDYDVLPITHIRFFSMSTDSESY